MLEKAEERAAGEEAEPEVVAAGAGAGRAGAPAGRAATRPAVTGYRLGEAPESSWSPYMPGTAYERSTADREREIDQLVQAIRDAGGRINRKDLVRRVPVRQWGPGRFPAALHQAIAEQRIRRAGRDTFELGDESCSGEQAPPGERPPEQPAPPDT